MLFQFFSIVDKKQLLATVALFKNSETTHKKVKICENLIWELLKVEEFCKNLVL